MIFTDSIFKHIRQFYLLGMLLFSFSTVEAQLNLVPNSSFEVADTCPGSQGQINFAHGWFNANTLFPSTTDYHNTCGTGGAVPPSIWGGYQYPHSGQAFIGIVAYTLGLLNSREYAEIELSDTLTGGKSYYVEYYVVLGNLLNLAISNLGAYFTNSALLNNNYTVISVIPQIENPDTVFLGDTLNWMKVSGTFIASGGEKFITIGSFRDDSTTNDTVLSQLPNFYNFCYYLIDDVSVIPVDSLQGIADIKPDDFLIYPNPVKDLLNIKFANTESKFHDLTLSDLTGKIILQKHFSSEREIRLDLSEFLPGMYFLKVEDGRGMVTKKIIKL